jgi:hypothetical protein
MTTRVATRWWIAAGFVAGSLGALIIGQLIFLAEETWPTTYQTKPTLPDSSEFVNGVDKPVGMVFSLSIGLFVLVGFVLREMTPIERAGRFVILACGAFLFASMCSIYMGFLARTVALYYVSFPVEKSIILGGRFATLQLVFAAFSGLFAILLLSEHYLSERAKTGDKSAPSG